MKLENNTVKAILQYFREHLAAYYGPDETRMFAQMALEHYSGITKTDYVVNPTLDVDNQKLHCYVECVERLKSHQPIQYILGHAWFYNLKFSVDTNVLIPRPETEELVHLILEENKGTIRIADICTGSGCIAISLKHNKPESDVWATDLSDGALTVAKQNAKDNNNPVTILKHDALSGDYSALEGMWDVWVSNPPYIPVGEKHTMSPNVLEYEPHQALFVPDSDALLFYRAIAKAALDKLNPGGRLYFECHTDYAQQVVNLLAELGYNNCKLILDLAGRNRMVSAVK